MASRTSATNNKTAPKNFGARRKSPKTPYDRRMHGRSDISFHANAYCHGRFQTVLVRNVSRGGLMMRGAFGLGVGDHVTCKTLHGHTYEGAVVWSISPYIGVAFERPLHSDDPIFQPIAEGSRPS